MTDDQALPGVWGRYQRGGAGEVETTSSCPGLGEVGGGYWGGQAGLNSGTTGA